MRVYCQKKPETRSERATQPESEAKPKFASRIHVHRNGVNQAIAFGGLVTVEFTTKTFDGMNEYLNTAGNYYFQPKRAGYYLLVARVGYTDIAVTPNYFDTIFIDDLGVLYAHQQQTWEGIINESGLLTAILYLTPLRRIYVQTQHTLVAGATLNGAAIRTYFMVHRLS